MTHLVGVVSYYHGFLFADVIFGLPPALFLPVDVNFIRDCQYCSLTPVVLESVGPEAISGLDDAQ